MFLRNVGMYLQVHTALLSRRQTFGRLRVPAGVTCVHLGASWRDKLMGYTVINAPKIKSTHTHILEASYKIKYLPTVVNKYIKNILF
jgi:hypothetical protein